jgi:hypothetical protein
VGDSLGELFDEGADLVSYPSIVGEGLLISCGTLGKPGRIVEGDMQDGGFGREDGTAFASVTADGDDEVEVNVAQLTYVFGAMSGDIDADFGHDFDGAGVEAVSLDARRVGSETVAPKGARPALGHLASAGVPGAEEEDVYRR